MSSNTAVKQLIEMVKNRMNKFYNLLAIESPSVGCQDYRDQ